MVGDPQHDGKTRIKTAWTWNTATALFYTLSLGGYTRDVMSDEMWNVLCQYYFFSTGCSHKGQIWAQAGGTLYIQSLRDEDAHISKHSTFHLTFRRVCIHLNKLWQRERYKFNLKRPR